MQLLKEDTCNIDIVILYIITHYILSQSIYFIKQQEQYV